MRYDKLVRDGIPDIIAAKGEVCSFHVADDSEFAEKLYEKLREETEELIEGRNVQEIADVLEVVDAIISLEKITREEVRLVASERRTERGGFERRIILEES